MDAISLAVYMHKKFNQYEKDRVDYITSGNLKNIEEYKFSMGELSMLRTLRDELREALHIEGDTLDE
jgi:hypothetical protein